MECQTSLVQNLKNFGRRKKKIFNFFKEKNKKIFDPKLKIWEKVRFLLVFSKRFSRKNNTRKKRFYIVNKKFGKFKIIQSYCGM